ncbi:hypothetical protein ACFO9Q_15470 [Paenibacillus sp. GCM10023252]|uniref:hypothetical protein n=1 Tax=Paenibacillus sp. GCM10023252 TaxID=3252649 RepID=UPI00360BFE35
MKLLQKLTAALLLFTAVAGAGAAGSAPASAAQQQNVSVKLPTYAVHVNGVTLDSARAAYPVVVYKGITYFPMTWNYARALGLTTAWNKTTGLTIQSQPNGREPLKQDNSGRNKAGQAYTAKIASFPIKVNNEVVVNAKQKYPILQFRDVTYFPMTWHFTHDLFKWENEWNAKTGYHVRGTQEQMLAGRGVVSDAGDYLYVMSSTGDYVEVNKNLQGDARKLIGKKEYAEVVELAERKDKPYEMPESQDADKEIIREGDALFYNNQNLVDLTPYLDKVKEYKKTGTEESGVSFDAYTQKLDVALTLLTINVSYLTHIPGPYTPSEIHLFVLRDGQAQRITGFSQYPDMLARNADGSYWLASHTVVRDELTTRNFHMEGQVALIRKDGSSRRYNSSTELNAVDIDLLSADENSVIVHAYNDKFNDTDALPTDGFFRLHSNGKVEKLAPHTRGKGYVDDKGQLYVVIPERNTITNLTTKQTHRWWDYELTFR